MSFLEKFGFGKSEKTNENDIVIQMGEIQKEIKAKEDELRVHNMKMGGNVIPPSPINQKYAESLNQEIMGLRQKLALMEAKKNQQS